MPTAAAVLGAAEIAYHSQALALFPLFDLAPPVLLPRSHLVLAGPPERRAAEALGIGPERLLEPAAPASPPAIAEVEDLLRVGSEIEAKLAALAPGLKAIDQTLSGAGASRSRSEERRVGKECRIGCRSRWWPYH